MALIEKFPWYLFFEGNTGNTGNTVVEIKLLGEFFRRRTQGYDSNTTLLFCLRVEDFFEGVSEEGNTGNTEWL